ncbi:MAG: ribonuclease HIII [Gemmatimonadota bacterium]|nr:ribonuclease HIII [Gemmatimonadota bacterium]
MALTTRVSHLLPYSRAWALLSRERLSEDLSPRVRQLQEDVALLRSFEHALDDLGNHDNDPNILFDILSEAVNGLKYDAEKLKGARLGARSRTLAAAALLEMLGWDQVPSKSAEGLRLAISDLVERERLYQGWGLFKGPRDGIALGLTVQTIDAGEQVFTEATLEILAQVKLALSHGAPGRGYRVGIEWPAEFTGESLGLPMYVAAQVEIGALQTCALVAATGKLTANGSVVGVSFIPEKLRAAADAGMRRVLVPLDNAEQARASAPAGVEVLAVANVSEVASVLRQPPAGKQLGFDGLLRLLRSSIPSYALAIQGEKPLEHGYQFAVADANGNATIRVYRNGKVEVVGKDGAAKQSSARLIRDRTPAEPQSRPQQTFNVPTVDLRDRLNQALNDMGALTLSPNEHEVWRKQIQQGRSRATVVLYTSGKCLLSGHAPAWDSIHETADRVMSGIGGLGEVQNGTARSPAITQTSSADWAPHIGTDEAGKGDYFGPLVSAAVYVDRDLAAEFQQLGVRDSKDLSDKRVRLLAEEIRRIATRQVAVVPIHPKRFNSLYAEMSREGKNLNSLLAWSHSRSIGLLLKAGRESSMQPSYVLVDQFGASHYIEERTLHVKIPVHQQTKAEADIAVATASILARDSFLGWLDQWSAKTGVVLPKGASPAVIQAGKTFVRKWGSHWLPYVAKVNFRTTKQVVEGESENGTDRRPPWVDDDTPGEG